jgi:hypothetical protein
VTPRAAAGTLWLAMIGAALHIAMDLPTTYGTRVLSPFTETWYAMDWMPIIDIYLWAVLLGGVIWSQLRAVAAARVAIGVLLFTIGDYGTRAVLHEVALEQGASRNAAGQDSPCASSPTFVRHPSVIEAALAGPESCIEAAALPTFLSPLQWRIVRQYPNGYELSDRDVRYAARSVPPVWIPSEASPMVARARQGHASRVFLDFSRFPASRIVQTGSGRVVVRMTDVRFIGGPLRIERDQRMRAPFVVTVTLDEAGRILDEQYGN